MVESLITYNLPQELIAQAPTPDRSSSRLMRVDRKTGELSHRYFRELSDSISPGDCLVLNDTRVIPARLRGKRPTGGTVEILLLRPGKEPGTYSCLARPAGKLKIGAEMIFREGFLKAFVIEVGPGPERLVRFEARGDLAGALRELGEIPLPPYIRRPVEDADRERYQTVYARREGAVAAPTAGLHFTPELMSQLRSRGVQLAYVTLHVGPGTFRPPTKEEIEAGRLQAEWFELPKETVDAIKKTKSTGGRVIAVGTTSCRVLETCMQAVPFPGVPGLLPNPALPEMVPLSGWTELFIRPGFQFRVIDGLITNFHLPETSLLSLVAAFAGKEQILRAYETAVAMRYRFYSYGDAMLIL